MQEYIFLQKIETFDLTHYIGLIGWIGDKPQKIYTSIDRQSFYLHDEELNKLFEFTANYYSFEGEGQYDRVIKAYREAFPPPSLNS